jgi:hypothetical protein
MDVQKVPGRRVLKLLPIALFLAIGLALTGCGKAQEQKGEKVTVPSQEVQSALERAVAEGYPASPLRSAARREASF